MSAAARYIGDFDHGLLASADVSLRLNNAALCSWQQGPRLTDYVCRYSLSLLEERIAPTQQQELAAGLNFALSELLENVAKFASDDSVDIRVDGSGAELVLSVENALDARAALGFAERAEEIANGDPLTMMLEQVEAQAEQPEVSGSGLGLLTMINDYDARVGWCFQRSEDNAQTWRVAIVVRFALHENRDSSDGRVRALDPSGSGIL